MKAVCVFCGSSSGTSPAFVKAARDVGAALANAGVTLTYGGGTGGLMGEVSAAALSAGGYVHGVMPSSLQAYERSNRTPLSKQDIEPVLSSEAVSSDRNLLTIVDTMHQRKQKMATLSDAFLVLPGGFGTLEELAEMTTWSQLSIHSKPVLCLNVEGFFTPLRHFIEGAIASGFIRPENGVLLQFLDESPSQDWGEAALEALAKSTATGKPYALHWGEL